MTYPPGYEPTQITIGETVSWEIHLTDYPADDGWTLTYYLRGTTAGQTGLDVVATPDGATHLITIPAAETADLDPGRYLLQAFVTKDDEKYQVRYAELEALIALDDLAADAIHDDRSTAKKIVDAIDAIMANKATADQLEYSIGAAGSQRQLKRLPPTELIALRKYYAAIVRSERRRLNRRGFKTIRTQFDAP